MSSYDFKAIPTKKKAKEPPPSTGRRIVRIVGRIALLLAQLGLLGLLFGVILFGAGYIYMSNQLADAIDQVVAYQGQGPGGTPRFFDRNGALLFELTTVEKRRWLEYHEIPEATKLATVSVEDDTFWTNPGFDPSAIAAAFLRNAQNEGRRPVGASTITQQLVRHIAFTYEERIATSYERKAREIFLAFILTQQRSKQDILKMYLNEIYYGNLAYGIEAAAQTYFGKPAAELTLAESAFLAGLPQSPIELNPYINFEGAKARQELILDLMLNDGVITYVDVEVAKGQELVLASLIPEETESTVTTLEAAHFVLYAQSFLERRYGADALVRGGWQITTSLDLRIQDLAEQAAREWIAIRNPAHDVDNAAIVVMKPNTGEILAMVGSLDYFDESIDGQVNVALQPRQPGSSFKPITYAAAMEQGWTTGDVIWDIPIKLDLGDGETMTPVNYSGSYHGPVLLRDALANSYNIPPIQLARDVGINQVIEMGRRMGIESLSEQPGYYGLSLTLGGGEVPLLEMTHAYATLANAGQRPQLTSVLRIIDSRGNVIYDVQQQRLPPVKVIDERIAYIITHILDDDLARRPAMGANNDLALGFPAAVKTGTTNDFRDNWTIGYTPGVVIGIWVGNTDGHPMTNSSGLRGAAPLWRVIMENIYANPDLGQSLLVNGQPPPTDFIRPDGIEDKAVCLPAGTGGSTCSARRNDLFLYNYPPHGITRLGYTPDMTSVPGAWVLPVLPFSGTVEQQALDDGTTPPPPTYCVATNTRNLAGVQTSLFLPVPPYYPDEVRARRWASGSSYQMAPSIICPLDVLQAAAPAAPLQDVPGTGGGNSAPPPANSTAFISSPGAGATVSGIVSVIGTANFDPATVQYYKLEIGSSRSPSSWTTFGTTHSTPVVNGVLETLHASALPPGEYTIRLILVQIDGNFANPYNVPITITQ